MIMSKTFPEKLVCSRTENAPNPKKTTVKELMINNNYENA